MQLDGPITRKCQLRRGSTLSSNPRDSFINMLSNMPICLVLPAVAAMPSWFGACADYNFALLTIR
jgi:hypothetical protein